jgi:DNA processing protein
VKDFLVIVSIIIMLTSSLLIHLAICHQGNYFAIKKALDNPPNIKYYHTQKAITILDPQYPNCLKHLTQPPWVLFYEGNLHCLKGPSLGIVGSRYPSVYAKTVLHQGFSFLNKNLVIVSGGADGIDGCAHFGALQHNMATIWVCAHGLDRVYPHKHEELFKTIKENYLVISEYPLNTLPLPHHFIERNRIVAALSDKLLVMSASLKSGTMHSVKYALELNKEIVTIPHPINENCGEGCNHLIENGASMLTNVSEFATL